MSFPLPNLQLLTIRPSPTWQDTNKKNIADKANTLLRDKLFTDLIFFTTEGPVSSHQSLLVPISPILRSLVKSYPVYPGFVHTVIVPMSLETMTGILQLIYTGNVWVESAEELKEIETGLWLLGISLPTIQRSKHILGNSLQRIKSNSDDVQIYQREAILGESEFVGNHNMPYLFNNNEVTKFKCDDEEEKRIQKISNITEQTSLSELRKQMACQLIPLDDNESIECNVVGCDAKISLHSINTHFENHKIKKEVIVCYICKKFFLNDDILQMHMREDHSSIKSDSESFTPEVIRDASHLCRNVLIPKSSSNSECSSKETEIQEEFDMYDDEDFKPKHGSQAKAVLPCKLCNAPLLSEWHRTPMRHKCPAVKKSYCDLCNTEVLSSWHLPPSRHACPAISASDSEQFRNLQVSPLYTSSPKINSTPVRSVPQKRTVSNPSSSRKRPELSCQQCDKIFSSLVIFQMHMREDHNSIESDSFTPEVIRDASHHYEHVLIPKSSSNSESSSKVAEIQDELHMFDDEDFNPEDGSQVETVLPCKLCNMSLLSEWHRTPMRHNCTSVKKTYCDLCNTEVSSSWHLPPTRHACSAISSNYSEQSRNLQVFSLDRTSPYQINSRSVPQKRPVSNPSSSRNRPLLSCQKCDKIFSSLVSLRTHYTLDHYWNDIASKFSPWVSRCYICYREFSSDKQLVRHMGNFHSFVDQCLAKEGYELVSIDITGKLQDLKCCLCGEEKVNTHEIKSHLAHVHFRKELEREFNVQRSDPFVCVLCQKEFSSSSARMQHIGAYHAQVLKYVKEHISIEEGALHMIPENDFDQSEDTKSRQFEQTENDHNLLSIWNPIYVQEELAAENLKKEAEIDKEEKVEDLKLPHGQSGSIQQLETLVTNDPQQLSTSGPSLTLHPCPIFKCVRKCSSRKDLMVHLSFSHYLKEIEKDYGTYQKFIYLYKIIDDTPTSFRFESTSTLLQQM